MSQRANKKYWGYVKGREHWGDKTMLMWCEILDWLDCESDWGWEWELEWENWHNLNKIYRLVKNVISMLIS